MFTIQFTSPYTQQSRTRSFSTMDDALRMIEFYRSCGTKAVLV